MSNWPDNVGILAVELIFPSQYVDQTELEQFDGVSTGKYTIGLGQQRMGFCSDREDIHSLCLTVVANLLERHTIPHARIGRLEVGTETIVDKSKSVKTVLMQLFEPHGVTDIDGIDTTNACYGGTSALFNAINWIESSSWDGRLALVVCADIAVYAQGSARPTGGAGAVAMLIGPDAPLVFDRGIRASCMKHSYDFYKPDFTTEYPTVDGQLSIKCYLSALDNCYQLYCSKYAKLHPDDSGPIGLRSFDAVLFHTPFCKLVQKSLARIGLNDFVMATDEQRAESFAPLTQFNDLKLEDTYFDRTVEKAFMTHYNDVFVAKTKKSLLLASQVGNMYTPSVYSGLVSLLINSEPNDLLGKRIALFSYGSGFASSLYTVSTTSDADKLATVTSKLSHLMPMLRERVKVSPADFTKVLEIRQENHHKAPYEPSGNIDVLFPGTYYLKSIDDKHRRVYERVPPKSL